MQTTRQMWAQVWFLVMSTFSTLEACKLQSLDRFPLSYLSSRNQEEFMVTACHTQLTWAQVQGTQIELGQGQGMEEQGVLGRAVSSPQEEGHMMMHIYQY